MRPIGVTVVAALLAAGPLPLIGQGAASAGTVAVGSPVCRLHKNLVLLDYLLETNDTASVSLMIAEGRCFPMKNDQAKFLIREMVGKHVCVDAVLPTRQKLPCVWTWQHAYRP
jgi:hypothetical protein